MKKITVVLMVLLFLGIGGFAGAAPPGSGHPKNPNAHELYKRIRREMRQIQLDLKSGKISQAQAEARRKKVQDAHDKASRYRRSNGDGDLSQRQKDELNGSLDRN